MNCPKCGHRIEEGMLLCSRCGCEIQYVPDFEPEIENSIQESMSNVAAVMDLEEEDSELDLDLDPDTLDRYGLGDKDLNKFPTQEMPVKEVGRRMPTQDMIPVRRNPLLPRKILSGRKLPSPGRNPMRMILMTNSMRISGMWKRHWILPEAEDSSSLF